STAAGEPVWRAYPGAAKYEVVSVDLPELGPQEQLRHRFRPGNCLGLIALIQFVRSVFGEEWSYPTIRSCFLIDDPNTRRPTYGHIDYSMLARHADEHGYHVAFAHIPLDLSGFDPRTVALFRAYPSRLSLALHGNNHTRQELASAASVEDVDRAL